MISAISKMKHNVYYNRSVMNSNMRLHLSSLLNKESIIDKHERNDKLEKERHERPRMFGREITNECLPARNKSQSRLQSKSFFSSKDTQQIKTYRPTIPESKPVQQPKLWCQQISPYVDDIYHFMTSQQVISISAQRLVQHSFSQAESKMRSVLVDWLIDVHFKFKLIPETLFKAIGILDRYITTLTEISPKKLQLIGIASLFIASKYQQIYPPSTRHYLDVLCKAHSLEQLIEMQGKILKVLNFDLTFPTSFNFLQRLMQIYQLQGSELYLPMYLLELSALNPVFLKYNSDLLSHASVFLAKVVYKKVPTAITTEGKQCAKLLLLALQNAPKSSYQASRNKFSNKNFSEVSTIVIRSNKDSEKQDS